MLVFSSRWHSIPIFSIGCLACMVACLTWSGPLRSQDAEPSASRLRPRKESSNKLFCRVVEDDRTGRIILQLPVRRFERQGQTGPSVTLHSVVHIADRSFFERQQSLLDAQDVVLYEMETPAGTGRPKYSLEDTDSPEWRIATTKMRMRSLENVIKDYSTHRGKPPSDWKEVVDSFDDKLKAFTTTLTKDGWGNAFRYVVVQRENGEGDPGSRTKGPQAHSAFDLLSLGGDNAQGGEGEAADIRLALLPSIASDTSGSNRYRSTAKATGLVFQGDAMFHDKPQWRSSDLSSDQIRERMIAAGVVPQEILQASPLEILFSEIVPKIRELMPYLTEAAKKSFLQSIADAAPSRSDRSGQDARYKILINDRNQVVIDDFREILERETDVKSVGIIYGGAHMHDLESSLQSMEYQEVAVEWIDAVAVTPPNSGTGKKEFDSTCKTLEWLIQQTASSIVNPREYGVKPTVDYLLLGDASSQSNLYELALAFYQSEKAIQELLVGEQPNDLKAQQRLCHCYDRLAEVSIRLDREEEAMGFVDLGETTRQRLAHLAAADGQSLQELSLSYDKIGEIVLRQKQTQRAFEFFLKGQEIRLRQTEKDPENLSLQRALSWSYGKLGELSFQLNETASATDFLHKAATIRERLTEDSPKNTQFQRDLAWSYEKLGEVSLQLDHPEEALTFYQKALAIRQGLADRSPRNSTAIENLLSDYYQSARAAASSQDFSQAAQLHEQALKRLEIFRKKVGTLDTEQSEGRWSLEKWEANLRSSLSVFQKADRAFENPSSLLDLPAEEMVKGLDLHIQMLTRKKDSETLRKSLEIITALAAEDPAFFYQTACAWSRLSGLANDNTTAQEEYARQSLESLRKIPTGNGQRMNSPATLAESLKQEPHFVPLRSREDFQSFLKELESLP